MRVSKKTRYGLRLMYELAVAWGRESVSVSRIAELEGISPKFLSQIIIPLKAAGLITSERGAHGGYTLPRKPEEISVFNIYSTLEGETDVTECVNSEKDCSRAGVCVARDVWVKLQDRIVATLSAITLKDLVVEADKKQGNKFPMYQI